jgi:hypothetical protein
MMKDRKDVIGQQHLAELGLLPDPSDRKRQNLLGIFIKQTEDQWSFVHDSFREFLLAQSVVADLNSEQCDFLKGTSSFDYVGAETYDFVDQLLRKEGGGRMRLIERYLKKVKAGRSHASFEEQNNLVMNCFEALGMIARPAEARQTEVFIRMAVGILEDRPGAILVNALSHTKYNVIRFLERIHPSSPKPYFDHTLNRRWQKYKQRYVVGAYTVRGFRLPEREIHARPAMVFEDAKNDSRAPLQGRVSRCLIKLLQPKRRRPVPSGEERDELFCRINASQALIRWLHRDDLPRLKALMQRHDLDARMKGNLFLALWRLGSSSVFAQFEKPTDRLFAGMKMNWVPQEVASLARSRGYRAEEIRARRPEPFI